MFLKSLSGKYGKVSTTFSFSKSNHNAKECEARVFEATKTIVVFKPVSLDIVDVIPFSSILDFSIDEDIKITGGNTATTTTKTSTGSMVKRGLVGGVLFGGVGALAGAATAKQSSQTIFDKKTEEKRYSIPINIDSISSPIYTMYFGFDSNTCKKVAGILTVIIRQNSTSETAQNDLIITTDEAESNSQKDPLFDEVARMVVMSSSASTSSLQRRYSIGYNRAELIMYQLEAAGIVGPSISGKPRDILVDEVELERILND